MENPNNCKKSKNFIILKASPVPTKQKRRTRSDTNDRNYTCGCGKSYLSYPALYTHLKQKHNGSVPEGTILPNNPKTSRGRPKTPRVKKKINLFLKF